MDTALLLTIDLETTLNGNPDIGLAHPMCKDNKWVYCGFKYTVDKNVFIVENRGQDMFIDVSGVDFLVGHNIPFDLLYLYKNNRTKDYLQKYQLWDTQLAEYILTGQQNRFASLDQLAVKYGLPLKADKIKAYFEAGLGADKIPVDEIAPYLRQDVTNTEAICHLQMAQAQEMGMFPLICSQMEALHATTEMMYNGLKIDPKYLLGYTKEVADKYSDLHLDITSRMEEGFDINSPKQWSTYLFGGFKKVVTKEAVGLYKNGKPKYKNVETLEVVIPATTVTPKTEWLSEKTKQVSVDDETLCFIRDTDPKLKDLMLELLDYRSTSKQLTTYIQGMCKHIQDDYIYGHINHTATVTGRLSSSKPNLQNISNNPIKKVFTSRYVGGKILEFDFSQLEVVVLAHLSGDKKLIEDITTGKDIHSELYNTMYKRFPDKDERKLFKSLTFGLIYGAGANTLAKNAKIDYTAATQFVKTFYNRYPQVKNYHESFPLQAELLGLHLKHDGLIDLYKTFTWRAETNRIYVFKEYKDDKGWSGKDFSYSPTELKNYPVQGLATGDIVPMMLGILFRKFVDDPDCVIINTIHDSIMFDCKAEAVERVSKEVKGTLDNTHEFYKAVFDKPLSLKLNAGVSVGDDWYNMKEVI